MALTQSTLNLTASPSPSTFGASVVLTAAVTPSGATGKVTFYDGVTVLGSKPLSSGTASLSTILLPTGTRNLTAYYSGDTTYAPATATFTQTVNSLAGVGFGTQINTGLGSSTGVGALGDFNGDGKADLVIVGSAAGPTITHFVAILPGNGDGTFQAPTGSTTLAFNPVFITIADFNGDGIADVLASAPNGSEGVAAQQPGRASLLLGNGDGTFQTPIINFATPPGPLAPLAADFNRDGKVDLVFAGSGLGGFTLLGNGDGTFQTPLPFTDPFVAALGPTAALAVGDFNGDGRPDLVSVNAGSAAVALGNGDGTFQAFPASGNGPVQIETPIAIADFNGDGKLDVAFSGNISGLSVQLGNGDGTFQPAYSLPAGLATYMVYAGDFNGDGIPDLAATNLASISLLQGNGDGTFHSVLSFPISFSGTGLVAGDFNGDGRIDFAGAVGDNLGTPTIVAVLPGVNPGLSLTATGGAKQSAIAGTPFANPLQVTLTQNGAPVAGVAVTFTAPTSGSSAVLSNGTAMTNAAGVASVTATANATTTNNPPGYYTVTASVPSASGTFLATFSLTNTVGVPTVTATGGTSQAVPVGLPFPTPLTATVKDQLGNPVSGVIVTFAAPATGASAVLQNSTAVTNAAGVASMNVTANNTPGTYTVTATAPTSVGNLSASFLLTNTATAASIAATGGTPQSAIVGIAFSNALQVTVRDSALHPLSGVTVTFTAPATGASATLSSPMAVTNAAGVASVTATANNIVGPYTVTAMAPAAAGTLSTSFSLNNTTGPPSSITATGGTPQSTTVGLAFANALTATVKDSGGNPVNGVPVTFVVPTSGPGVVVTNATVLTNANGQAITTATANLISGSYTVAAIVGGVSPLLSVSYSLTNLPVGTPVPSFFSQLGTYRTTNLPPNMAFSLDSNGNNSWDGCVPGTERTTCSNDKIRYFGNDAIAAVGSLRDVAVAGDWDGTGVIRFGVFHCATTSSQCAWYIDMNNNGKWDGVAGGDAQWILGIPGDIPVVGDWTGDGISKIGTFRCAGMAECQFFLDLGNKHTWDPATVGVYRFGLPGDLPAVGNWATNAQARGDQIGVMRCPTVGANCTWIVDSLGKTGQPGFNVELFDPADQTFTFTGPSGFTAGDVPVVGSWNGDGKKRSGIFRASTGVWYVDTNGNGVYDVGTDQVFNFGLPGDQPIVGLWKMPGPQLLP